jgi:hypothetical protein
MKRRITILAAALTTAAIVAPVAPAQFVDPGTGGAAQVIEPGPGADGQNVEPGPGSTGQVIDPGPGAAPQTALKYKRHVVKPLKRR